jgi:hypothetical protein
MHHPKARQKLMSLAVASACAAAAVPALAQESAVAKAGEDTPVQSVVVTGMRASMQSSMNLKRNSDGIVDGIVAEDIGKFPDTNLAESLQRISGVSIDRNDRRGLQDHRARRRSRLQPGAAERPPDADLQPGRPEWPRVRLRQPGVGGDLADPGVQDQPRRNAAGGIGATLNVMTARPLDRPGMQASASASRACTTSRTTTCRATSVRQLAHAGSVGHLQRTRSTTTCSA